MQPAAFALIFSDESRSILLIQRQDVPVWTLPGGGIEKEEAAEIAVIREVKEETGLDVEIVRKCAEYLPTNRFTANTQLFLCRRVEGELTTGDETAAIDFFPLDRLPRHFFFLHKIWMDEALRNPSKIVKRPITEVTLTRLLREIVCHPLITLRFLWKTFAH